MISLSGTRHFTSLFLFLLLISLHWAGPPYEIECRGGKRYPCLVPSCGKKHQCLNNRTVLVNGFPGGSAGKEPACSAGDPGWISESGRSSGGESGFSSTPAWRTHWAKPAGLTSKGSQRAGRQWAPDTHIFIRLRTFPSIARCLRMFVLNGF